MKTAFPNSSLKAQRALRIVGSLLTGFLLWKTVQEFYLLAPAAGSWLGRFSPKWMLIFLAFTGLCLLISAACLLALWLPWVKSTRVRELFYKTEQVLAPWPKRLGRLRWPLAIAVALLPAAFFLYTEWGDIFSGPYLRLLALLVSSALCAMLITKEEGRLASPANLAFAIVLTGALFYSVARLITVTNYPFALSWSEGNRLYDFSVQVDPQRYQYAGDLSLPYKSPGRYILWGVLFLIPNTPIWLHRLWDALLWIVPYLIFGYQLARWTPFNRLGKLTACLWFFLFLAQGPIYPSLLLSAILVAATCNVRCTINSKPKTLREGKTYLCAGKWALALAGVALAGYYASASRWTWLPASAAWGVIILLSRAPAFQLEEGIPWLRQILRRDSFARLLPIALVGVAGLAAGALSNSTLFSPRVLSSSTTLSQPLLWYRLFPNATYADGILFGLAIATLPMAILLVWLAATRRWPVNWLQALAYLTASLAFLTIGVVASVKIGGGSNLHNLDMFFVTLAILAGLALRERTENAAGKENLQAKNAGLSLSTSFDKWPVWAICVLAFALVLPAWNAFKGEVPLHLPSQEATEQGLDLVSMRAEKIQRRGEVLFIDQRQLLTFGYIENVILVPEYEKKFMMDQAMAGDADYFETFYHDLRNQRFSLIVTEPMFMNEQDNSFSFQEENNAWVSWVVKPVLCYYAPIATLSDVRVQLLVPRASPTNCE